MIMLFFIFCIGVLIGAFVTCIAQIYLFRHLHVIIYPETKESSRISSRIMISNIVDMSDKYNKWIDESLYKLF